MREQGVPARGSPNIIWSILDGEALILDTSSGHYFSLNPIATEIWQCLQHGDSVTDLVERIASKYRVEKARIRQDVNELLSELRAAGLHTSSEM
jgi:coenzyme PQQ synthesis protein D (PqqD)